MGCLRITHDQRPELRVVHAKKAVASNDRVKRVRSSYPFGMLMPDRHDELNGNPYTYGFNGMERDEEVKGTGKHYTTLWRQYDPRLGLWFSLDPEMAKFPDQSPYAFVFNNPINLTDIYGDCPDQTDCETMGSKAEKTANSLMKQNGGNTDFSSFEFFDEQRSMLFNEDGGLNALGKQVNTIIKDQAYLQKHNTGAADMLSEMVNSGKLSNAALTELSGLRSQLVSETKTLYMQGTFSPENVGMIIAMYSPAKLPSTRGSSMMQSELPLIRKAYMKSVGNLQGMGQTMLKQGYSKEVVAKVLHAQRRYLGTVYKDATPPELLKQIHARNMARYGDKMGPTIKYLRKRKGASWDDIINSASRTGGKDLGF